MKKYNPQQCLADILHNIEVAREYMGSMTVEDLHRDTKTLDAILRRLENASEAHARLWNKQHGSPDFAKEVEERHPDAPWRHFQSLANRYRHDYDILDVDLIWDVLQPNGVAARVEAAIRKELPLSQQQPCDPI